MSNWVPFCTSFVRVLDIESKIKVLLNFSDELLSSLLEIGAWLTLIVLCLVVLRRFVIVSEGDDIAFSDIVLFEGVGSDALTVV